MHFNKIQKTNSLHVFSPSRLLVGERHLLYFFRKLVMNKNNLRLLILTYYISGYILPLQNNMRILMARNGLTSYGTYLQSESWRKLRTEAMKRDGYICQACKTSVAKNVHHFKYPKDLKDDSLDNLVSLCELCHCKRHKIIENIKVFDVDNNTKSIYELSNELYKSKYIKRISIYVKLLNNKCKTGLVITFNTDIKSFHDMNKDMLTNILSSNDIKIKANLSKKANRLKLTSSMKEDDFVRNVVDISNNIIFISKNISKLEIPV